MAPITFVQAPLGAEYSGFARVLLKRHIGKIMFCRCRFLEEDIQMIFRKESLENYSQIVNSPKGSLLEVSGKKIHSSKGTPSLEITSAVVVHIYKGNLPDPQNPLSNKLRYRRRVIDLTTNEASFMLLKRQSVALMTIRKFLYEEKYGEFVTGTLQEVFEGGQAVPFETYCRAASKTVFLSLTSELKLKRLLVAGFSRVFEISQSFRNEGSDKVHTPEFTLLEAYAHGSGYLDMMKLLECMVEKIAEEIESGSAPLFTSGRYKAPFERLVFKEVFESHFGDFDRFNIEYLSGLMPEMFNVAMSRFTWIMKLIEKVFVPTIPGPAFLVGLPAGMSPFVKNMDDGITTERAFFVADGLFIADIYTDENDFEKVRNSLEQQMLVTGNKPNEEYLTMLSLGLGRSAGLGMGLNRLAMLFLGVLPNDIKETILYPIS